MTSGGGEVREFILKDWDQRLEADRWNYWSASARQSRTTLEDKDIGVGTQGAEGRSFS